MISNNSIVTPYFSCAYPALNDYISLHGDRLESRVGNTMEVLDFKTTILQPRLRCVGGASRNINIFFLLAEALWIWAGKNDVGFLSIFNSRMKDFSDDGVTFNAPYGFRLRHYGSDPVSSFIVSEKDDNLRHYDDEPKAFRMDQIKWVLNLLDQDPNTRRAVATIWNPEFDTRESKDIPCNDLLMFKIRNNKLHLTIANRSNDLHWGLCTNVFQFSFIAELMAEILGVELGQQTHNSQSLHIYDSNPLTTTIKVEAKNRGMNLYDFVSASSMCLNSKMFLELDLVERLKFVDSVIEEIIDVVNWTTKIPIDSSQKFQTGNEELPPYFLQILHILRVYTDYVCHTDKKELAKERGLGMLCDLLRESQGLCSDYFLLAMNWFAARLPENKVKQIVGSMEDMFPKFKTEWLGKL